MTTEPRPSKPQPWLRATALELRLYAVALLAMAYLISWGAIGTPAPAGDAPAVAPPVAEPPRYVWLDRLPVTSRPVVQLPAGWQLASDAPATETPAPPRIVRVPARQRARIRTRSS